MFQVHFENLRQQPGVGSVYRRLTGRPAWVWGTALAIGLLPFAVLIVVIAAAALLTTALAFAVLSGIDTILQMFTGSAEVERTVPDEGRENVRVIPDQH